MAQRTPRKALATIRPVHHSALPTILFFPRAAPTMLPSSSLPFPMLFSHLPTFPLFWPSTNLPVLAPCLPSICSSVTGLSCVLPFQHSAFLILFLSRLLLF